jgi:aminopeptidase N
MRKIYRYMRLREIGPAVVDAPEDMFSERVYLRGAQALYALRQTVGDKTFFRILATFAAAYRGRSATSADFIRVAVSISGEPAVSDLLEDWLYGKAIPELPGQTSSEFERESTEPPDLVGLRCGRGGHRGSAMHCH